MTGAASAVATHLLREPAAPLFALGSHWSNRPAAPTSAFARHSGSHSGSGSASRNASQQDVAARAHTDPRGNGSQPECQLGARGRRGGGAPGGGEEPLSQADTAASGASGAAP